MNPAELYGPAFWEAVFARATQPASDRSEQDQED